MRSLELARPMSGRSSVARILLFAETDLGEVLEAALNDAGRQCVRVCDASQALALHADGAFDAAIIDMDGGDRGALALIREMRARSPCANILACIWRGDGSDAERSAGASTTLEKPFGLRELLDALEPIGR